SAADRNKGRGEHQGQADAREKSELPVHVGLPPPATVDRTAEGSVSDEELVILGQADRGGGCSGRTERPAGLESDVSRIEGRRVWSARAITIIGSSALAAKI